MRFFGLFGPRTYVRTPLPPPPCLANRPDVRTVPPVPPFVLKGGTSKLNITLDWKVYLLCIMFLTVIRGSLFVAIALDN